jgi:serine/threonine-protein kinase RsbW
MLSRPAYTIGNAQGAGGPARGRMTLTSHTVRLDIGSAFDMLDFVEVVCGHVSRMVGFDDDTLHWISIAVRESVANAMKHGNKGDEAKRVKVEFTASPADHPCELSIVVQDQGEGFEPEQVADPLAPENLLKSSGRGIFLIRSFMDEVVHRRIPEGGMEIRMVKRMAASDGAQP